MSGILKAFQDFLVANGWAYVRAWLTMITERRAALRGADLGSEAFFAFAAKFMVINAALCVLFGLPGEALAGLDYLSPAHLVSSLTMLVAGWVGMASILHLCLRARGGRAPYRETFAIFAMFTAFYPLVALIALPVGPFIAPILADRGFTEKVLSASMVPDLLATVPLSEWIYVGVAWLFAVALLLWMHILIVRAALMAHRLGHWRALGAVALYVVALLAYLALILGPINNLLLRAFA